MVNLNTHLTLKVEGVIGHSGKSSEFTTSVSRRGGHVYRLYPCPPGVLGVTKALTIPKDIIGLTSRWAGIQLTYTLSRLFWSE